MKHLENELLEIFGKLNNQDPSTINLSDRLKEDLNMDSLNFLELEYEIQQLGAPELSDEEVEGILTVNDALLFAQKHIKSAD